MRYLTLFLAILLLSPIHVGADESGLIKKRCTCYMDYGETASGYITKDGVIAGRKQDLGKVAAIYRCDTGDRLGEFIGYYEFKDTGAGIDTDGDGVGDSIRNGLSIDVYKENMEEINDWIAEYGDYVFVKYIDADG